MGYIIKHQKRLGGLDGFYSNGGFSIGDVFSFSTKSYYVFKKEKQVLNKITDIIEECKNQADRWGEWSSEADHFAKGLYYEKIKG